MTIFGNQSSSYPCCYRFCHASLFLCAPSSFLTSFHVPFIPSTSLPISDPHITFYILLCSLMYKSLYILPQITTQSSPSHLPTTTQLLKKPSSSSSTVISNGLIEHSSSRSPLSSCDPHYRLRLSSCLQKPSSHLS